MARCNSFINTAIDSEKELSNDQIESFEASPASICSLDSTAKLIQNLQWRQLLDAVVDDISINSDIFDEADSLHSFELNSFNGPEKTITTTGEIQRDLRGFSTKRITNISTLEENAMAMIDDCNRGENILKEPEQMMISQDLAETFKVISTLGSCLGDLSGFNDSNCTDPQTTFEADKYVPLPTGDINETYFLEWSKPRKAASNMLPSNKRSVPVDNKSHHHNKQKSEGGAAIRTRTVSEREHVPKIRDYQSSRWLEKFDELCKFRSKYGHCQVPHAYEKNRPLGRWTKRQRYQYKQMTEGKASTMTKQRADSLEKQGFIWDSQNALWMERLNELKKFRKLNGHCNVPSRDTVNQKLAVWVKIQRRQRKLFCLGRSSNITADRIAQLDKLGFTWEIRRNAMR